MFQFFRLLIDHVHFKHLKQFKIFATSQNIKMIENYQNIKGL